MTCFVLDFPGDEVALWRLGGPEPEPIEGVGIEGPVRGDDVYCWLYQELPPPGTFHVSPSVSGVDFDCAKCCQFNLCSEEHNFFWLDLCGDEKPEPMSCEEFWRLGGTQP